MTICQEDLLKMREVKGIASGECIIWITTEEKGCWILVLAQLRRKCSGPVHLHVFGALNLTDIFITD